MGEYGRQRNRRSGCAIPLNSINGPLKEWLRNPLRHGPSSGIMVNPEAARPERCGGATRAGFLPLPASPEPQIGLCITPINLELGA